MTAVLLAAGVSSRLRPLTDATPKSLLPVGGKPLLQRALEILQGSGVQRCIIVTGYLHEMLEAFVRSLTLSFEITFVHNPFFSSTNNNYSLWLSHAALNGDAMLLLDADILFDQRILRRLLESPHVNALVMRRSNELGHEEIKVELNSHDRVVRIGKEVEPQQAAGESLGIEKFSATTAQKLFETLGRRKHRNEFYEASFQEIIDAGTEIYTVESGGFPCMEIDTPEDYALADRLATASLR